jgi:hypothetical protein
MRDHQAGGTIVAQRFSWLENSLVGTLKFFQESRCSLITFCGVSRDSLGCAMHGVAWITGF